MKTKRARSAALPESQGSTGGSPPPVRPSSIAVFAVVALAGFTAWITRQAKALEQDLDVSSQKIALLDKPAPDFRLTSLDGRGVSLADYRGKKLVLVFWASWNNGSHPAMLMLA